MFCGSDLYLSQTIGGSTDDWHRYNFCILQITQAILVEHYRLTLKPIIDIKRYRSVSEHQRFTTGAFNWSLTTAIGGTTQAIEA